MRELVVFNLKLKQQYEHQFFEMFHFPIEPYMHPIFGFDIVKFDKRIGTPDDTSCADFLREKYGEEAVMIIEGLIS